MNELGDLAAALTPTYRLERELGGGGMSRVFVATETTLNRRVAIKVVPIDGGTQAVERFRREISTAAQLQHPHIVPVLTAGEANGVPWFAMPFVAGESLRARVAAHGAMPLSEALKVLRDVALALSYAHAQGFVHRDIKPDNVLLADGAAVVTDFGVAKALSSATNAPNTTALTGAGIALGTPAYMAPEQVSADPAVDHRADLYAWGCMAYELFTGMTPFGARSPSAIYAAHLTETPQPVRSKRAEVPLALARLVEACLEKDPARRPQSARDLLTVLDQVATPSGTDAAATRTSRRAPMMLVGGVVLAVLVGWYVMRGASSNANSDANSATATPAPVVEADRSVLVLPFENASGDTAQEYFSDGLTEELIAKLAESGLRVTGRNTAFSFKGKHPSAREAGKATGVGRVLTGTVRRLGANVRISAELASASEDVVLWTFKADRPLSSILALQAELVDSIAGRFAGGPPAAVTTGEAVDPRAYDLQLRARSSLTVISDTVLRKALVQYDSALALQPDYVDAIIGKASVYAALSDGYLSPRVAGQYIKPLLERARAIDSTRPAVLAMSATYVATWEYDWPRAMRYASQARRADLFNYWATYAQYICQVAMGDLSKGFAVLDTMSRIADPLNVLAPIQKVFLAGVMEDRARAAASWDALPTSMREFVYADVGEAITRLGAGRYADAITAGQARESQLGFPSAAASVALARTGRAAEARRRLATAEKAYAKRYFPPEMLAWVAAEVGDTATMYRWLDVGVREQSAIGALLGVWGGALGSHRNEPHFQEILHRMRLTPLPPSRVP